MHASGKRDAVGRHAGDSTRREQAQRSHHLSLDRAVGEAMDRGRVSDERLPRQRQKFNKLDLVIVQFRGNHFRNGLNLH